MSILTLSSLIALGVANLAHSQEFHRRLDTDANKAQVNLARGYIFLEGRYLPPPYDVELRGRAVILNGMEVSGLDLASYTPESRNPSSRGGFALGRRRFMHNHMRRAPTPVAEFSMDLKSVSVGRVFVLFSGRPPLALERTREGQDLIKALCDPSAAQQVDYGMPDTLTSEVDRETWTQLVSEFQPPTEFLNRALGQIQEQEQVQSQNLQASFGTLLVARIEYPITIFAMIAVVLGFGHLLSNKPQIESPAGETSDFTHSQRIVGRSLLIVGALSILDLVWTIVASQAGTMRELNPLGGQLILDPLQLFAFKLVVTSAAIGLLYCLHRHPIAQVASWWSCLVLTLLTARWLTFHSMLI